MLSKSPLLSRNDSLIKFQNEWMKNTQKYTPNSISILINFGLNDKHFFYNAAEDEQYPCQAANELWDPFSRICRPTFCNANFNLQELSCKNDRFGAGFVPPDPIPVEQNVMLNFTVFVQLDSQPNVENLTLKLQQEFKPAFANKFFISQDRIDDVDVTYVGNRTLATEEEIKGELFQTYLMLLKINYWSLDDIIPMDITVEMIEFIKNSNQVHQLQVKNSVSCCLLSSPG